MSISLDRTNTYPGKCFRCGASVGAMRGFLLRRDALDDPSLPGKRAWLTLCNSKPCVASVVGEEVLADADRLAILADGTILKPAGDELLPYLRALGSYSTEDRCWRASPHRRDRDHVIAVATKLGFEIAPEFADYTDPRPVREAVARARAIESIREYQVSAVRRSAYVGIDDSEGCFDEPVYNVRDRTRGWINGLDPGLGKTIVTLLAVADDEALVVVCNKSAVAVWPREAKKWRGDRFDKFTICEGMESFEWPTNPREMVVVNYEILRHTPAMIRDEIEHVTAKLDGWTGNADSKVPWQRKDITGLRPKREALVAELAALEDDTATGGAGLPVSLELEDVEAKIRRQELALERAHARKSIGAPPCPVFVVADECHYVESHKAQRAKKWRHLASYARRVIGLTGTPVESEPFKLWGLLTSCNANPFGFSSFLRQFNATPAPRGGYEFARHPPLPGSTAKGSVKVEPGTSEQLARCLMRLTQEQALPELPPQIFSEIPVALSPKIRAELDEITAVYATELLAGEIPPFAALSATLKVLAKACIPTLLDLVQSYELEGTPVVVFSANRSPVEALAKRKGWFAVLGGGDDPGKIEDKFQAGEGVGVAGTQAMAESMTLTRASTLIQVIPFMARKKNKQAYKRLHRLGQREAVNIILLVPDHVLVHHIFALLVAKDQFVDDVLEGDNAAPVLVSRFVDESAEAWAARAEAKRVADAEREASQLRRELNARERELTAIATRDVTPKVSEARARLRAGKLGDGALHRGVDPATVAGALDFMLARCDGAVTRDGEGFNRPDGCVARWLAPGVHAGSEYALASAAAILRHYPQQLATQWPALFAAEAS